MPNTAPRSSLCVMAVALCAISSVAYPSAFAHATGRPADVRVNQTGYPSASKHLQPLRQAGLRSVPHVWTEY